MQISYSLSFVMICSVINTVLQYVDYKAHSRVTEIQQYLCLIAVFL